MLRSQWHKSLSVRHVYARGARATHWACHTQRPARGQTWIRIDRLSRTDYARADVNMARTFRVKNLFCHLRGYIFHTSQVLRIVLFCEFKETTSSTFDRRLTGPFVCRSRFRFTFRRSNDTFNKRFYDADIKCVSSRTLPKRGARFIVSSNIYA